MSPIHLFRMILQLFCNLGGQWVAPFILPFVNPFIWCSCCWVTLCCIWIIPANFINSPDFDKDDGTEKKRDFGRSFAFVASIIYVISVIIFCLIHQVVCKVQDAIPV